MKKENKSFFSHAAAGTVAGVISFLVGNKLAGFVIMIAILAVFIKLMEKLLGKEKFNWWFSNGVWIYIFLWLVSWTLFYNI